MLRRWLKHPLRILVIYSFPPPPPPWHAIDTLLLSASSITPVRRPPPPTGNLWASCITAVVSIPPRQEYSILQDSIYSNRWRLSIPPPAHHLCWSRRLQVGLFFLS